MSFIGSSIKYVLCCLSLLVISLSPTLSWGQSQGLAKELFDYKDTTKELIANGRRLIARKLADGDMEKVKEVKRYLVTGIDNRGYLIFYSYEGLVILYHTAEYKEALACFRNIDSVYKAATNKVNPPRDALTAEIFRLTVAAKPRIMGQIAKAELSVEDKDMLRLYLDYATTAVDERPRKRDTLNQAADDFLSKHHGSVYENYVRKNLRFRYVPANWGLGMEFFGGYGVFTGSLADYYKHTGPLGVAFDVEYKNAVCYLRDCFGWGHTLKDQPYGTSSVWSKGAQFELFTPEVSFGYSVLNNKRIKAAPFAGISSMAIGATTTDAQNQPSLENAGQDFTLTYIVGANVDFKFNIFGKAATPTSDRSYGFIRIRYAYEMPRFASKYPGINGGLHCITLGIGGVGRKAKRDL